MKSHTRKIKSAKKRDYSPTLKTIIMVEAALKSMDDSVIKVSKLKRILPKKINHYTLMKVIDYLDRSNKIVIGTKGVTWIFNDNPKMRKAISGGFTLSSEDIQKLLAKAYK